MKVIGNELVTTMPTDNPEELKKLLELVREAVQRDDSLREKYSVGHKFRFVRDRLHILLDQLEKKLHVTIKKEEETKGRIHEDEVLVYVYLYNAQGLILRSWENMLTPKVFYEYSVNRPIYMDKNQIDSLLRSKPNKTQHAYLTIAVKKVDIIKEVGERKDALGNLLVRVKEGSLHFENLILFTHNFNEYEINSAGELIKKLG